MSGYEFGDYFVQHSAGIFGLATRIITRSPVSHAGVSIGVSVVEALSPRVVVSDPPNNGIWSTDAIPCTPEQRTDAARHAYGMVGTPYGWLNVFCLGLLQYGIRIPAAVRIVGDKNTLFCSQLVDEAYRLAGVHLFDDGRDPLDVTPGDLYNLILEWRQS